MKEVNQYKRLMEQQKLESCPKTITGRHFWERVIKGMRKNAMGVSVPTPEEVLKCYACGMIDDRDTYLPEAQ